jgi:hypothetical protein
MPQKGLELDMKFADIFMRIDLTFWLFRIIIWFHHIYKESLHVTEAKIIPNRQALMVPICFSNTVNILFYSVLW